MVIDADDSVYFDADGYFAVTIRCRQALPLIIFADMLLCCYYA